MAQPTTATEIHAALLRAVRTVNDHAGETCVHVRFANDPEPIDFVADAARLVDGAFEFQAGFETLSGSVNEIESISAETIGR